MLDTKTYSERRKQLKALVKNGVIFIPGNKEAAFNYPANTYSFRQDSSFLYFFGIDHPDLCGVMDVDENKDYLFGNDVDIDDIIWMGNQPAIKDQAATIGVSNTAPLTEIDSFLKQVIRQGRKVHYLPPYRGETVLMLSDLLGIHHSQVKNYSSVELIKAVVNLRSIKDENEIREIENAADTAFLMHTTGMKMAKPGVIEREIVGAMEGLAIAKGGPVSFPVILTINGQTLHNHYHGNVMREGNLVVMDAGCESLLHYASDITRTVPVGGKFNQRQKEIYEIVLQANLTGIKNIKPGIAYRDVHLMAAETIADGLKQIGLMKGDVKEAVKQGAHALFFPHGLGHMLGLDVHDMENLGENYVGYNEQFVRSSQFGLAFLRLGRTLEKGFVLTVEPGIYFIPALIDQWKAENKFSEFINYDKVNTYKDFGGIRMEDDVLVTADGYKVLGKPIPKTVAEIEDIMK